jgi:release factor glutamine methyltransferase
LTGRGRGEPPIWTVGGILAVTAEFFASKGIASPRLDAELLLGRVLDLPRVKLYICFERELEPGEVDLYRELVRRRSKREPTAYILGEKEFYALRFAVTADVLIPRPETERLVDEALGIAAAEKRSPLNVCDVGTGCGAIAAAMATHLPEASVEASDVSPAALEVARRNLDALGLGSRVNAVLGSLMDAPFRAPAFDLICANLPYVPTGDIPSLEPDVRDYEPGTALDGGPDGLALYRPLLAQAPDRLKRGGTVLLECQPDQFPALEELAAGLKLTPRAPAEDLSGRKRIFSASRP